MTTPTNSSNALLHLLRLVSPALPVGAYVYSQGLETAVENGWVKDKESTEDWLNGAITHSLGYLDAPVFLRLYDAWKNQQLEKVSYWNNLLLASRETAELLLEDSQMGSALMRLLKDQGIVKEHSIDTEKKSQPKQSTSFVTAFALASSHWSINPDTALQGLLWSWLENQVAAAIKLVPLGQTQGQQLLLALTPHVESTALRAKNVSDEDIGWSLPRAAMASMQHEHQYSRLFRS